MIDDSRVLDALFDYKNQVIGDIITDSKIVEYITDDPALREHPEKLVYLQVFPWESVPGTTENATTYVCCEVDVRISETNNSYVGVTMYVWAFTHESLFRLPNGGGIRYDRITSEIARVLNGSRKYGLGKLRLKSVRKFSPIQGYAGRTLVFEADDFNFKGTVTNYVPNNRKADV